MVVSVSTTGSKGRKHRNRRAPRSPESGFSIHDWIEGSKTHEFLPDEWRQYSFSIHDWIEGSKTRLQLIPRRRWKSFSIHDWIEGSKTVAAFCAIPSSVRFSIHDWIEGSKTGLTYDQVTAYHLFQYPRLDRRVENPQNVGKAVIVGALFQYPRLDRRVENDRNARGWIVEFVVSVSTTGSKGRKHPPERVLHQDRGVSVSTTGSKGRKLDTDFRTAIRIIRFSIHDWIEGSKTYRRHESRSARYLFQYPRLDRRVENNLQWPYTVDAA